MRKNQIFALFFCLYNLFYVILHKISILYIVAKLKKIMKIKKLYAEPAMKFHKLTTSRMIAGSSDDPNPGKENEVGFDPEEIDAD